jgi:hypothetical protein
MSMLRLRLSGEHLVAFDGRGAWWEVPAVLFGWRVAKRTTEPANSRLLGATADRVLRRIVGLPGELAPTPADFRIYSAPLRAVAREEVEA